MPHSRLCCPFFHFVLMVFSLLLAISVAAQEQAKPNIVLIISDDQAWTDYSFMGHPVIETPNLDLLSTQSLLFERGYVASPLCRPSLASMVTGLYAHQHGVTGNDVDGMNNRAELSSQVTAEFNKLPSMVKTLVDNGYLAHQSGKWWEGSYADGGFTHGMTHGDPARGGRHGDEGLKIGRQGMQPIADFMDLAIKKDKPFFVWYAPFLPHTPHNPPQRLLDKYAKPGVAMDVAKYYAMCEWFDETCGELIKLVEDRGLREDTVFLYICDNGWAARSTNDDDPNQKQWGSFALRSKGSPYENGIRTPIMVSWPGKIQPKRSKDLAHAIDLFPTVCSLAGITPPDDLPGIDLTDAEAREDRKIVFGETHAIHNMIPGNPDGTLQYIWAIDGYKKVIVRYKGENKTRYALVHDWDTVPNQMYDLRNDPHENDERLKDTVDPETIRSYMDMLDKINAWRPVDEKLRLE